MIEADSNAFLTGGEAEAQRQEGLAILAAYVRNGITDVDEILHTLQDALVNAAFAAGARIVILGDTEDGVSFAGCNTSLEFMTASKTVIDEHIQIVVNHYSGGVRQ